METARAAGFEARYEIQGEGGIVTYIVASYDDEMMRETVALALLGTETRSGGTVVRVEMLDENGNALEEFEA